MLTKYCQNFIKDMRQNKSIVSSKRQRTKITQINLLKNDLMSKINGMQQTKTNFRPASSQKTSKYTFHSQPEDLEIISFDKVQNQALIERPKSILQKAKQITRNNKEQIESAKKAFKKSNHENEGMFLTGCGLYRAEDEPIQIRQDFESVNLNDALKFLVAHEKDDLQELRRMIKKTNSNMKEYSREVTKTTGQVQNAADLFGRDFNIDLKVKINRCKPIEKQFQNLGPSQNVPKRKISTSGQCRNNNIY